MQKFKVEKPVDSPDNQLLEDFNDELEAMRGADSEGDEITGLIGAAATEYRNVGPNEPLTPRLGLFLPQDSVEKRPEEEEQADAGKFEEEPEPIIYYNEDI